MKGTKLLRAREKITLGSSRPSSMLTHVSFDKSPFYFQMKQGMCQCLEKTLWQVKKQIIHMPKHLPGLFLLICDTGSCLQEAETGLV